MLLSRAVVAVWWVVLAAGTGAGAAAGPMPVGSAPVTYAAPLSGAIRVVRGFDPPVTRFGRGHLGVDLATTPGETVRAAAPGRVTFAGPVAGRGVVVIMHRDGIRTEYEPVRPSVQPGESVRPGQSIGRLRGNHGACAPGRCLHWSARRGSVYLDPLSLLQPLGPVRLLPWLPHPGG